MQVQDAGASPPLLGPLALRRLRALDGMRGHRPLDYDAVHRWLPGWAERSLPHAAGLYGLPMESTPFGERPAPGWADDPRLSVYLHAAIDAYLKTLNASSTRRALTLASRTFGIPFETVRTIYRRHLVGSGRTEDAQNAA